jgi:hypothetical protein
MVEDNIIQEVDEETGEIKQPINYEDLVTEEPEREVSLEDYEAPKSVSEVEEETQQTSDIKAILSSLMPKLKHARLNELAKSTMVSRIFPDNLLDRTKMMALCLLEEYDEYDPNIPVLDIFIGANDINLIGYEGRRIVELLELAGVAHEEEMQKLAKDLGL